MEFSNTVFSATIGSYHSSPRPITSRVICISLAHLHRPHGYDKACCLKEVNTFHSWIQKYSFDTYIWKSPENQYTSAYISS